MSLDDKIRRAQIHAGEHTVIRNLHDRGLCDTRICLICRELRDPDLHWQDIDKTAPPYSRFVLVKGDSGYRASATTHPEFQTSASYDTRGCWVGPDGEPIADNGWSPTHWRNLV